MVACPRNKEEPYLAVRFCSSVGVPGNITVCVAVGVPCNVQVALAVC